MSIICLECNADIKEWKSDDGRIIGFEGFMCLECKAALCPDCANKKHFIEEKENL